MDKRAYNIRNSNFLDLMIKDAIYSVDSTASIIKSVHDQETIVEACRQMIIGLLSEFRKAKDFSRLLDELNINNIYLTDIDKVLRVGDKVVAILEFKHVNEKDGEIKIYIKKHTLETLNKVANALNCRVLLITYYQKKWYLKDITGLKIFYDYKVFRLEDMQRFDDKELLNFVKELIQGVKTS